MYIRLQILTRCKKKYGISSIIYIIMKKKNNVGNNVLPTSYKHTQYMFLLVYR